MHDDEDDDETTIKVLLYLGFGAPSAAGLMNIAHGSLFVCLSSVYRSTT